MLVSLSFLFGFNINIYLICIVLQFHNIPSKLDGNESPVSWSFLEVFKLNGAQSMIKALSVTSIVPQRLLTL